MAWLTEPQADGLERVDEKKKGVWLTRDWEGPWMDEEPRRSAMAAEHHFFLLGLSKCLKGYEVCSPWPRVVVCFVLSLRSIT